MKALTIWQPWATLIMIGAKPIEWRGWCAPTSAHGQRIGIHAGARTVSRIEVQQLRMSCIAEGRQRLAGQPVDHPTGLHLLKTLDLLADIASGKMTLPRSAMLGTAVLGEPRLAADFGFPIDSDRLDQQNWGWPFTEIEVFPEPVPARGAQGLWSWEAA